jgi:hypothetical protein
MDLRFTHMHKQLSHSVIRSFESLSAVFYVQPGQRTAYKKNSRKHYSIKKFTVRSVRAVLQAMCE